MHGVCSESMQPSGDARLGPAAARVPAGK